MCVYCTSIRSLCVASAVCKIYNVLVMCMLCLQHVRCVQQLSKFVQCVNSIYIQLIYVQRFVCVECVDYDLAQCLMCILIGDLGVWWVYFVYYSSVYYVCLVMCVENVNLICSSCIFVQTPQLSSVLLYLIFAEQNFNYPTEMTKSFHHVDVL